MVRAWYQAAQAEGPVRVYADLSRHESEELEKVFRRRYRDVTVAWTLGTDRALLARALAETEQPGMPSFDVFVGDLGTRLKAAGLAERWSPPEAAALLPELIDGEGAWYGAAQTYHVLQFSTEQVAPTARPRAYEELADPRYLGRLAVEENALGWLKGMIESRGRQPAVDALRSLAEQGVAVQRGPQSLSHLIGAGRFAVAISNRLDAVERDRRGGAKTAWAPIEPVVVEPTAVVLSSRAPHPNAARLFANWLLSADAQVALAERGRVPARRDVDPEPQTLVRGIRTHFTLPPEASAEPALRELYRDLWRR